MNPLQFGTSFIFAIFIAIKLMAAGWPWYAWLPASLLSAIGLLLLWVIIWFIARKLTYPGVARRNKARHRKNPIRIQAP